MGLRALSLGGGVQSSALLLMANEGLISLDLAIFADTGWEPRYVYDYLDYLEEVSSIPIVRVSKSNLKEDLRKFIEGEINRFPGIPIWIKKEDGKLGKLWRQCTYDYKVKPIRRFLKEELKRRGLKQAELALGITTDEARRAKESEVKYVKHVFPLLDMNMSRQDVIEWMASRGYKIPPKSACLGCPFRSKDAVEEIARLDPEGYSEVLRIQDDLIFKRRDFFKGEPLIFKPGLTENLSCGFCEV